MKICVRIPKAETVALFMEPQQRVADLVGGDGAVGVARVPALDAAAEERRDVVGRLRFHGYNF
jgi:hypothetical protein